MTIRDRSIGPNCPPSRKNDRGESAQDDDEPRRPQMTQVTLFIRGNDFEHQSRNTHPHERGNSCRILPYLIPKEDQQEQPRQGDARADRARPEPGAFFHSRRQEGEDEEENWNGEQRDVRHTLR